MNPLEDAEATLPLDEATQLSRRHQLVELPALLEKAKAPTPIEDAKVSSLRCATLEVAPVGRAAGAARGGQGAAAD